MKYFIAAVIIITFLFQIFIKPSDFINNLKVSYLNKKYALDEFNSIKEAYEKIIFCREYYYKGKFLEDPEEKEYVMSNCKRIYEKSVVVLNSELHYSQFLPPAKLQELNEILETPIYELI